MSTQKNVLLVNLYSPRLTTTQAKEDAAELYYLVESLEDAVVVDMIHQRSYPSPHTYIGSGKVDELLPLIVDLKVQIVVVNGIAKPQQLYNLWKLLAETDPTIIVWDRVDLILQIFAKHAHTAEAKLQIELAAMKHMGPKIYGMGHVLSQQAGGIGTRGIGETNVELMKRHWRDAIRVVQKKLDKLKRIRTTQIERRKTSGGKTVSIVGYTNAGKTSLFNRLTQKGQFADDLLFATLDSTIGTVYLPKLKANVYVSDTIGFIQNLPPDLIEAFTSTLLESIHADILVHVIDGSSSFAMKQFQVVNEIISSLGIEEKAQIVVINKIDLVSHEAREAIAEQFRYWHPILASNKTGEGVDELRDIIATIIVRQAEMGEEQTKIQD